MAKNALAHSQDVCQKLLRGYQFSASDSFDSDLAPLYHSLDSSFSDFHEILAMVGFNLTRDGDVIFLENSDKLLSKEDKQLIVVLFLLVDLWMEKGKPLGDLYQLSISWRDLDWFREGYGRDYLAQVNLETGDLDAIEDLFRRVERKGLVKYRTASGTITLRRPAERLINMARRIDNALKGQERDDASE